MSALVAASLALLAAPFPSDSVGPAASDTLGRPVPVVRTLAPVEVHALLPDLLSSQTVQPIAGTALHDFPLSNLREVLSLQAGVVAHAEELHVRGGRAGETTVSLEGMSLTEPLRRRAMNVPLLALRSADLVSGAPEARYASGLAGTLNLKTVNPSSRPAAEFRWQSDARTGTRYDRIEARAGGPLAASGLGVVAAADATLDDTALPTLRSFSRHSVLGLSLGWRAENHLLGFLEISPVRDPERFSLQVLGSRSVEEPYSPNWSLDGWTSIPASPKGTRYFSPVEIPGYARYRAADHMGITDTRDLATLLSTSAVRGAARATLTLGWLRTSEVLSVGGNRESGSIEHRPSYGPVDGGDGFYVVWGDLPLYRESNSDTWQLRLDGHMVTHAGNTIRAGTGLTYEDVSTWEYEWFPVSWLVDGGGAPFDSIRSYHARAPGGFAYVQGRWISEGMVLNGGLRAEYFTAGSAGDQQTLPGRGGGIWSFSPRLGIAYPISVKDVFSLAYARIQQAPGRDFLYDDRRLISNRLPLGNPALGPATLISYEASIRHLLSATWAMQASVFYRDLYGLLGTRWIAIPGGPLEPVFSDADEAHTMGFEWSLLHAGGERRRLEVHYTWMQAWGNESNPEGEPFGPLRGEAIAPIADAPLSWDRRHSISAAGFWRPTDRWALAWTTAVGSPFPWTPRGFRETQTHPSLVNSRRLSWTENTNLSVQWTPPRAPWVTLGLEVRNLFDHRGEHSATLDGYPSPTVNTLYDDYGAYRTETGLGGGGYWSTSSQDEPPHWVPVHDPRLFDPPRTIRASLGARW